jgi:hypothetical protein
MLYEAVKFKIRTQDFGLFQCSDNATFRQSPHDILIVVAAGNSMENLDDNKNCFYPVCFDAANMLAVREVNFTALETFCHADLLVGLTTASAAFTGCVPGEFFSALGFP